MYKKRSSFSSYLIFIDILSQFGLSELVEGNYDQGDEDVDEEEGEDDEVDDVEDRHFSSVACKIIEESHTFRMLSLLHFRKQKIYFISRLFTPSLQR